ncbi:peroxin Pex32 [Schizosaccharomyces japonicus yFS275]|uniref:Peroxin Pex32 n=1 Tax=Schizosaccharomyces japonicus (strain yFS275 / FY16936) TaxID=402676 RepID=B6JYM2_SCHJY|nr:peroxin Pex32 [Schizosaccharomyces japonicus yFS275]EEB06640.1 peroxin Pex32 [Schizosaccharomyces japonicus yFS275]
MIHAQLAESPAVPVRLSSTKCGALDFVLSVLLWRASWYHSLSVLFFTWLLILFPKYTIACTVPTFFFWLCNARVISIFDTTTEHEETSVAPQDSNATDEGDSVTIAKSANVRGLNTVSGDSEEKNSASSSATNILDSPTALYSRRPFARPTFVPPNPFSAVSALTSLSQSIQQKTETPSEPVVTEKSNDLTLLEGYLLPLRRLRKYAQTSQTSFFRWMPMLSVPLILILRLQTVLLLISTLLLAWHSPPLQYGIQALRRMIIVSTFVDTVVLGRASQDVVSPGSAVSEKNRLSPVDAQSVSIGVDNKTVESQSNRPFDGKSAFSQTDNISEGEIGKICIVEHQRRWVGGGWLNTLLPTDYPNFTNETESSSTSEPAAQLLPADGIAWIDEQWTFQPWTYTDNLWRQPWPEPYMLAFTRRRKWTRRYRRSPAANKGTGMDAK